MADTPAALQLRLLETVVEVAAEKNSTLVLPFPVELLRFLESATNAPPEKKEPANPHDVLSSSVEPAHRAATARTPESTRAR
jgi:hypothetical protein